MSQVSPSCLGGNAIPNLGGAVCAALIASPNQTIIERLTNCCGSAPIRFAENSSEPVSAEQSCITYCAYEPYVNATDFATLTRAGAQWKKCAQGISSSLGVSSSSSAEVYTTCIDNKRSLENSTSTQTQTGSGNSNDAPPVSRNLSILASLTIVLTGLVLIQSA